MTFLDIYMHGIKNECVVEMIKYILVYKKTKGSHKEFIQFVRFRECEVPDPFHPPLITVTMLLQ
jgi:hypothetical protein